jgi:LPS-assembly lipoprotein
MAMAGLADRSVVRRLAALLLLAALAGCGFRPLYGTHAGDPHVTSEMTSIYIRPMPDREGQLVHNALLVRFNPNGEIGATRFRLDVNVAVNEGQEAISRDATATRALITYAASYGLYEGNTELTSGGFDRIFSYDYVPEQYSNVSARADIGRRAAEEIADEIRNRIATYFAAGAKARAAAGIAPAAQP